MHIVHDRNLLKLAHQNINDELPVSTLYAFERSLEAYFLRFKSETVIDICVKYREILDCYILKQ